MTFNNTIESNYPPSCENSILLEPQIDFESCISKTEALYELMLSKGATEEQISESRNIRNRSYALLQDENFDDDFEGAFIIHCRTYKDEAGDIFHLDDFICACPALSNLNPNEAFILAQEYLNLMGPIEVGKIINDENETITKTFSIPLQSNLLSNLNYFEMKEVCSKMISKLITSFNPKNPKLYGLGAMLPSLTNYGNSIDKTLPDSYIQNTNITTGHWNTVKCIHNNALTFMDKLKNDISLEDAVVGFSGFGSIGKSSIYALLDSGVRNFSIFDLGKNPNYIKNVLLKYKENLGIEDTIHLNIIDSTDPIEGNLLLAEQSILMLGATSNKKPLYSIEDLPPCVFLIDDSAPEQCTFTDLPYNLKAQTFNSSVTSSLPEGYTFSPLINMPSDTMMSKVTTNVQYSCQIESLLMSLYLKRIKKNILEDNPIYEIYPNLLPLQDIALAMDYVVVKESINPTLLESISTLLGNPSLDNFLSGHGINIPLDSINTESFNRKNSNLQKNLSFFEL